MIRKVLAVTAIVALCAAVVIAQAKKAPASVPTPTKVEGKGVSTGTGLKYWDITVGTGAEAKRGSTVTVHYTGWFTNNKSFDSSVGGAPLSFKIGAGQVIKGWEEGVAGMKVGGKRQLRIPPDLAYGEAGHPAGIPPMSTLIFDVELLAVK